MIIPSLPMSTLINDSPFSEVANQTPGQIEDLCDLLVEDWKSLGSVHKMGLDTQKFFHSELERSWGSGHLTVLDEEEAGKWL